MASIAASTARRAACMVIDGSKGEGGGQVLRTSLALSALTGVPIRIQNIRAGRPKPGLAKQHLTAVQAAAQVSRGALEGDELLSTELCFWPGPTDVEGGDFLFDIGSAGATTLVLQTVLPILLLARRPSTVTVRGGTHNPMAPPYNFLKDTFAPILARVGIQFDLELVRHGFYPAGGGELRAKIVPIAAASACLGSPPAPLALLERGAPGRMHGMAAVANLSQDIARREVAALQAELGWPGGSLVPQRIKDATGPGNFIMLQAEFEHITETVSGFGERGVTAEEVSARAAAEMRAYLAAASAAPVGEHLADQLLLPLLLSRAGGTYRATTASLHFTTNVSVIEQFVGAGFITYGGAAAAAASAGTSGASAVGAKRPRTVSAAGAGGSDTTSRAPLVGVAASSAAASASEPGAAEHTPPAGVFISVQPCFDLVAAAAAQARHLKS